MSRVRDVPSGDMTAEQVDLLVRKVNELAGRLGEVVDMMNRYAAVGGRDWPTWDRLLDGIGRAGTTLMQHCGDPIHSDWHPAAHRAVAEAAGATVKDARAPEAVHRKLAETLLVTVWQSGAHFLVSPEDWSDMLPAIVLGAIRAAPAINDDDLMRDLRDR